MRSLMGNVPLPGMVLVFASVAAAAAQESPETRCTILTDHAMPYTMIRSAEPGPGPGQYDFQSALVGWVERDVAPDRVIATHTTNGVVDRSRPLCPFPQIAVYKGQGDSNEAENFVCREPVR